MSAEHPLPPTSPLVIERDTERLETLLRDRNEQIDRLSDLVIEQTTEILKLRTELWLLKREANRA